MNPIAEDLVWHDRTLRSCCLWQSRFKVMSAAYSTPTRHTLLYVVSGMSYCILDRAWSQVAMTCSGYKPLCLTFRALPRCHDTRAVILARVEYLERAYLHGRGNLVPRRHLPRSHRKRVIKRRPTRSSSWCKGPVTLLEFRLLWTYMNGSRTFNSSLKMHQSTDESWRAMLSSLSCNLIASKRPCVDHQHVSTSWITFRDVVPSNVQHSANRLTTSDDW